MLREISPLREGYGQHTSPHKTKGLVKANVASVALKYWQEELATKANATQKANDTPKADEEERERIKN